MSPNNDFLKNKCLSVDESELGPFLKKLAKLRYKQKQFFKTKSPIHLNECKALEVEIDKFLENNLYTYDPRLEDAPKTLFDY